MEAEIDEVSAPPLKNLLLHIIFIEIYICHHLLAPSITASQYYAALQEDDS